MNITLRRFINENNVSTIEIYHVPDERLKTRRWNWPRQNDTIFINDQHLIVRVRITGLSSGPVILDIKQPLPFNPTDEFTLVQSASYTRARKCVHIERIGAVRYAGTKGISRCFIAAIKETLSRFAKENSLTERVKMARRFPLRATLRSSSLRRWYDSERVTFDENSFSPIFQP